MGFGDKGVLKSGGNFIYSKDDFNLFVSAHSGDEKGHDFSSKSETENETILMREYEKVSNFTLSSKFKDHSLLFNTYSINSSVLGALAPTIAGGAGKNQALSGYLLNYMFDPTFFGWWNLKFNATYDWNDRNFSRSKDDLTHSNIDGYRLATSLKTNMSLLDAFKITPNIALNDLNFEFGVDYDYRKSNEYKNYTVIDNKLVSNNNMNDKNTNEYSLFGQGKYSVGPFKLIGTELPLTLLLGTRYTQNELFGNNISSRGTLVYPLSDKNSLKFIFGQSYRTPSLFELYFETPEKTVFGNKNLKPETSNSYELSYLTSFDKFFIQTLVYHADYQNAISRTKRLKDDAKDTSTMYTNNLPFSANGLEVEIKYQNPEILNAFVNYNFIKGTNPEKITAFDFKYVPEHTIALGLSKKIYDFSASSVLNLYSQTTGPVGTNGTIIPMQYTIDLNLGYDQALFGRNIRHNFSVKDILDGRMLQPEFVRKKINEVPLGVGRRFSYSLQVDF
ncbi:MAG: TonB-dependent receptor [Cyanobacteriota bacterium]|mgnify:FL=1